MTEARVVDRFLPFKSGAGWVFFTEGEGMYMTSGAVKRNGTPKKGHIISFHVEDEACNLPERQDGKCPRLNTCATRPCPPDWKECGTPKVLNVVSEWLYGDKFVASGEI